MQLTFRQGIVGFQYNPLYITLNSSGNVDLNCSNAPVVLNFSQDIANYLYTENATIIGPWAGPFNANQTYWLYWNIDTETALRTFGSTQIAPSYGTSFPTSPSIDQHFFNLTDTTMYYWNGLSWVECIRIFAGGILNGVITPSNSGSQVDVYNVSINVGTILFDVFNNPVTKYLDDGSFVYLTSVDDIQPFNYNIVSLAYNTVNISGVALEYIPTYYCVITDGKDEYDNTIIKHASYFDINNSAFAITTDNMMVGDIKQLVTHGYMQDPTWYWNYPPLTPLYVGGAGEITTYAVNPYSSQKIGFIVNLNTIFINIQNKIVFTNYSPYVTPSITPSISATPTPTLTSTVTVTPTQTTTVTITPSVTPTFTPSATITPTLTMSPTITPTVTPTFTPTITPTYIAPSYSNELYATLQSYQDDFFPSNYESGFTNMLLLTPASGGSIIAGWLAPPQDGFAIMISNLSATDSITFLNKSSDTPLNQFSCPGGMSVTLLPLTSVIIVYVATQWEFI